MGRHWKRKRVNGPEQRIKQPPLPHRDICVASDFSLFLVRFDNECVAIRVAGQFKIMQLRSVTTGKWGNLSMFATSALALYTLAFVRQAEVARDVKNWLDTWRSGLKHATVYFDPSRFLGDIVDAIRK